MTKDKVLDIILEELNKAQKKHPEWPADKIHAAAILCEEAGELIQASIDYEYEWKKSPFVHDSIRRMIKEAAQVGAMAIRFLINL